MGNRNYNQLPCYTLSLQTLAAPLELLHLEQEAEVLDGELAEGGVGVAAEGGVRHGELLRLQLDDLVLDRVLDDELCNRHGALLAETVDTVWGQLIGYRIVR